MHHQILWEVVHGAECGSPGCRAYYYRGTFHRRSSEAWRAFYSPTLRALFGGKSRGVAEAFLAHSTALEALRERAFHDGDSIAVPGPRAGAPSFRCEPVPGAAYRLPGEAGQRVCTGVPFL